MQGYGLLRKEIDFVPTTPRKPKMTFASNDAAPPMPPLTGSRLFSGASGESRTDSTVTRSLGEKKELLGNLVGNVDALVKGVGEAGIFGLS
jgi:hypothetical protein